MNPTTDQHWSNIYSQGRDFRLISSQAIDRSLAYLPSEAKTCLDIGCGTGQLTRELYHRGYSVVGIDASQVAVQYARQHTIAPADQLQYIHLDIESTDPDTIKLPHDSFDLITCKLVYAFIEDKPTFLKMVAGLLAPEGLFVVITPMLEDVEEDKKGVAIDEDAVELLKSYFDVVALYKIENMTYIVGRAK